MEAFNAETFKWFAIWVHLVHVLHKLFERGITILIGFTCVGIAQE